MGLRPHLFLRIAMIKMYQCPGELRHPMRGFLYAEKDFQTEEEGTASGWFLTLDAAAGVPDEQPKPAKVKEPKPAKVKETVVTND
jgi:hypothetical protein